MRSRAERRGGAEATASGYAGGCIGGGKGCGIAVALVVGGTLIAMLVGGVVAMVEERFLSSRQETRTSSTAPAGGASQSVPDTEDWYADVVAGNLGSDCTDYRAGNYDTRHGGFMRLWSCHATEAQRLHAAHLHVLATIDAGGTFPCLDMADWIDWRRRFDAASLEVAARGEVQPMRGFLRDTLGYDVPDFLRSLAADTSLLNEAERMRRAACLTP